MKKLTIYDMELHDELRVNKGVWVIRVPGGWIYQFPSTYVNEPVFVPFNNEFQPSLSFDNKDTHDQK